ncbi:MAG TPA: virulence RhuM family protein [Blastocatellia bacterium]
MTAEPQSQLLLYQTVDGATCLEVRLEDETVWLTQNQMAELFQTSVPNVSMHIRNIFAEGELQPDSVLKDFLTTATDGKNYRTRFYNLDVIISVGYRVKSHRGTQFRIWATQRLREYIVKGFAMDDERLKRAGGGNYFDELLARIRDIRSSERVFWRKMLEIYATSIDYDPREEASQLFFKTVQNKMHWAAHGHTAAEVVHRRADSKCPNMGLTNWLGPEPTRGEASIAKNYLTPDELEALNRIVNAYLEFAEVQALSQRPMYMRDWIAKLDDFLRLGDREVLTHAGTISHGQALSKAKLEYEKYRALQIAQQSQVEKDFEESVKKLPKTTKRGTPEGSSKRKKPN